MNLKQINETGFTNKAFKMTLSSDDIIYVKIYLYWIFFKWWVWVYRKLRTTPQVTPYSVNNSEEKIIEVEDNSITVYSFSRFTNTYVARGFDLQCEFILQVTRPLKSVEIWYYKTRRLLKFFTHHIAQKVAIGPCYSGGTP